MKMPVRARSSRPAATWRLGGFADDAAEDVFARGVHPVQGQHEQRDAEQVAVLEHHRERVAVAQAFGRVLGMRCAANGGRGPREVVDEVEQHEARRRATTDPTSISGPHAHDVDQVPRDERAEHRAAGGAEGDQREEALAGLGV